MVQHRASKLGGYSLASMSSNYTNHDSGLKRPGTIPVAICGMGMRLPGGIRDSNALFDFLLNKRDARGPVPPDRFNIDGFYNPHGKHGCLPIHEGYWLHDVDLSHFDTSMFSMKRAEIENLDPQQRLLLEVVRETFESAAETDWRGKNIGCYTGSFGEEWSNLHAKDVQNRSFSVYAGYMDLMQANRISYEYDLRGPSMTLRAGCSAGGLGVHLAFQSIQLGECCSAIVAATNIIISPETTMMMADGGALSPDASSKTFDASANGYVRAEGVNCLYLKRLDEAIRDGNPIRALIRGTSSNAGGRTTGLTVPNIDAQEALIRAAYRNACLEDPAMTAMVECHGTGTAVGDATEAGAIARIFGRNGVLIGGVKPNLGHSEGPAGITSIIKAVVELEHRLILPNIKFHNPNPKIPWEEARLMVPTEPTTWPEGRLERISVNSYGIGGSNVHIVLDSAASFGLSPGKSISNPIPQPELLMLSAGHPESFRAMQQNYEDYAVNYPRKLRDLAYTLSHRRERLPIRGFSIANGTNHGTIHSPPSNGQSRKNIAFVFTGQGAQWAQMGKELLETCSDVLQDIRQMDDILQRQDNPPKWTLEKELLNPVETSRMSEAEIAQPICTALQVALCNHLRRWNISPVATVGHSSGEIAAAYAAGCFGMRSAILLAYYRGVASKAQKLSGAMAAVGLGYDEVARLLKPGVVIACENSPASVTLSGDADALKKVLAAIDKQYPQAFQRLLKVNKAYHSHHMQEVGQLYDSLIGDALKTEAPKVRFFSTVTTQQLYRAEDFEAHYWRHNLENPVWFYQGFSNLLQSDSGKDAIVLEIGPHSALAGPIKQIYQKLNASNPYVSVLTRCSNGLVDFLSCVGELFRHGADVRYPLPRIRPKALHDLPLYPWHHADSWWSESRPMKASRFQRFPHHDILGARTIESSDLEPIWRNVLHLGNVSWIRDHCVGSDIVFPAAGYIAIAGHAVSQMTGLEDFTVQDVSFKTAMILDEAEPVEIITRLQSHRLTNSLNSGSFEFSIQSYNGKNWTQHCTGLVAGGRHSSGSPELAMTSYSRVVDPRRWYRAMARVGLRYGPRFVGLKAITAGVSSSAASASIENTKEDTESPYTLHPTTIDYILQSSLVATHRGEPCLLQNAALPSFIEQMYVGICPSGESIHINTLTHDQSTEACGMSGETLVFTLQGLEFTSLDSTEAEEESGYETAQLVWKPHLDFVDPTTLIKPAQEDELLSANALIERMFLLCIIDAMEDIKEIPPVHPHLTVYRDWMSKQLAEARDKDYPLVPDAKDLFALPPRERKETIQALLGSHTEGTMTPGSRILFRCYSHLSSIFKGDTEPLELMRRDGLLGKFYDCLQDKHDYATFLQLLGHLRPRMNVLEIGAGTGGLTAKILPFLQTEDGEELYQEYTYTDISSGFFIDARERFHDCSRIQYSVLDISKDPLQQGFSVGQYDLIIASNILHATPSLSETLGNVRTLLKSDGSLLLQELCPVSNWINFIFGLFSGWWLGKDDGRSDEPYVSPVEWDARLREAGFGGIVASALDAEYPHQLNAMMVAKPALPVFETQPVTLLCIDPAHPTVESIRQHLSSNGCKVDVVKWGEELPASQDIAFLLDIERPWFEAINKENLAAFLQIVKEHSTSKFLWVTHSAQIKPQDPRFAQILGMARTLRSELGILFATLEMQDFGPSSQHAIRKVLRKIQDRTMDNAASDFDADQEFAWADGAVHVGRMHWISVPKSLEQVAAGTTSAATLDIGLPGLLNTLRWVAQPTKVLLHDEVRIKTMSVSMNFRELLVAMGVVPKPEGQGMVGTDSAGIITAIGSNVSNLSIGDRVMAISVESSSYATELQIASRFCARIPDNCSFDDASTLPTVYLTILRTLREKANLRRGQTVLIHSAAGGVGIAAIHYAQSVAATIYATVSSPEKVGFLVNELGVAKENIFYSRDNSFLDDVMRATHDRGVDVVLNSLSGEQLHASWKCVAPGGSLIEIGKRDLLGRGQLAMNPFLANRSYIGVDIATLPLIQPEWVEENMSVIVDLYEQGVLKPIRPATSFPAKGIEDAFRHLQKGQHIGKLLIEFSDSPDLPLTSSKPKAEFRTDRAYLLVGGMRGIGASIATWMVSNGATNMVFLSRSAGEREEDKALVRQLSDMGCQVWTFAGDVADLETVQLVVSSVPIPFAGVLQLAMVLADTGIMDMDFERWNAAVKPKVAGTWNLHKALPSDLDFFVMVSSLSGIFGNYGQANYAAANTFLDAFAQFRRSKGLAASTVDLGVVDEIGWVSQNASIHRQVVQQMSTSISEDSLLDCLHLAILRSSPSKALQERTLSGYRAQNQLLHGILSKSGVSKEQIMWKRDPRTALSRIHHEKEGAVLEAGETKSSGLKGFLSAVQDNPEILNDESTAEVVATEIARQVTIYTMRDVDQEMDLSLSLQNFGLDSLVSIELRNWWKQMFGAEVTVLQLMNSGSLMGLGQKAVEQLKQKHLKP